MLDQAIELMIGVTLTQAAAITPQHVLDRMQREWGQDPGLPLSWAADKPLPIITKAVNRPRVSRRRLKMRRRAMARLLAMTGTTLVYLRKCAELKRCSITMSDQCWLQTAAAWISLTCVSRNWWCNTMALVGPVVRPLAGRCFLLKIR